MSTSTSKQARWVSSQGPASPDQGGRKGDTTFGTVMKYVMNELRGSLVSVELRDGSRYEGVYVDKQPAVKNTIDLEFAQKVAPAPVTSVPCRVRTPFESSKRFNLSDVVVLSAAAVQMGALSAKTNGVSTSKEQGGFRTDAQIGQGSFRERELQRWSPEHDMTGGVSLDEEAAARGSKTSFDQFEVNRTKYGVNSTFNMDDYTMRLDKNSEHYRRNESFAEQKAREIMRDSGKDSSVSVHQLLDRGVQIDGLDEDALFSSVTPGAADDASKRRSSGAGRGTVLRSSENTAGGPGGPGGASAADASTPASDYAAKVKAADQARYRIPSKRTQATATSPVPEGAADGTGQSDSAATSTAAPASDKPKMAAAAAALSAPAAAKAVSATGNGNARASPPPPSAAKQVETKREWAKVAQTKPPQPAAGGAAQAADKDATKGTATVAVAVKTDNASPRVGPAPVTANAADSAKLASSGAAASPRSKPSTADSASVSAPASSSTSTSTAPSSGSAGAATSAGVAAASASAASSTDSSAAAAAAAEKKAEEATKKFKLRATAKEFVPTFGAAKPAAAAAPASPPTHVHPAPNQNAGFSMGPMGPGPQQWSGKGMSGGMQHPQGGVMGPPGAPVMQMQMPPMIMGPGGYPQYMMMAPGAGGMQPMMHVPMMQNMQGPVMYIPQNYAPMPQQQYRMGGHQQQQQPSQHAPVQPPLPHSAMNTMRPVPLAHVSTVPLQASDAMPLDGSGFVAAPVAAASPGLHSQAPPSV